MDSEPIPSLFPMHQDQTAGAPSPYANDESVANPFTEYNRQVQRNARERNKQKRDFAVAVISKARQVAQEVEREEMNHNSAEANSKKLDLVDTVLHWTSHPAFDDMRFYELQKDSTEERSGTPRADFNSRSASSIPNPPATFGSVRPTNIETITNGLNRQNASQPPGYPSPGPQQAFKCPHPACPSNLGSEGDIFGGVYFKQDAT